MGSWSAYHDSEGSVEMLSELECEIAKELGIGIASVYRYRNG